MCYAFLAPYAILFFMFNILPVLASIFFSFTYYNVLEPPKFIGLDNYINLILEDDVFLTGVKNTFLIAVITGPVGYLPYKFIQKLYRLSGTNSVEKLLNHLIAKNHYYKQ